MIHFKDVRVPARNRIGEEGKGFFYQMHQFQEERLFLSASILVVLDRVVADTVSYTRDRTAFGQAIIDNQVVQFRLSELKTEIEAARALVYRATQLHVGGEDASLLCSMAKLKTARLAREVTDSCLQYWGAQGYMWENPVARFYRDLRLQSIGGGADEIMLGIIAKRLGYSGRRRAA